MALKKKPVTGMKDMMPAEMEVRDYVIGLIKETYKTFGFSSMERVSSGRVRFCRKVLVPVRVILVFGQNIDLP